MRFHISRADCTGNARNCIYQILEEVSTEDDMRAAVAFDHVCGQFKENKRSNDNFISSDVVVMDCDNDHSDNPADWITEDMLDDMFPDIAYVVVTSRHHMLPKDGKAARPRFHVYFPISEMTCAADYTALKRAIQAAFSFFDDNALDAARFIFGCDTPEITWHDGWVNIDEEVTVDDFDSNMPGVGGPILEGNRNNTLSRFASRILKRYGDTNKAYQLFMEEADKCDPPLDETELKTIWFSALKFFRNKVSNQPGYVPPDDYNADFKGPSLKPEDYSDIGEAKVLVAEYGDELLFTNATDYMRFDGEVWVENKQLAVAATEEFLDLQLQDAKDELAAARKALMDAGIDEETVMSGGKALEKALDEKTMFAFFRLKAAESYINFVMKRRDYKFITSTLNTAKPMVAMDVNDLDKDPYLLNTPFATFNLKDDTGEALAHDPKHFITKITEVSPSDEGMDLWLEALNLFFCGDAELIAYVQTIVGMAAIGKVFAEQMIIAFGGGANGKSTFWNTIFRVLGNYAGKISAESLTMGCKRNVKPEMAELKGKRLIIASEMEEGMRLNTATVKQLCSTDEIQAEKKYKDPFHFVPTHTLVLYTNHLPKVGANDEGIWRRLIVIPFNAHITGSSDIKNYADYLFENAGGAVLKWIIEGAKLAIKCDFKPAEPKCVVDAVQKYREDNDWLGQFIDDCCEVGDSLSESSGELYQSYRAYCISNGEYTRSTTDFYSAMDKAGFFRHKTNKGIVVQGVKVKDGNDFI